MLGPDGLQLILCLLELALCRVVFTVRILRSIVLSMDSPSHTCVRWLVSVIIGSRLEMQTQTQCRIAFYGQRTHTPRGDEYE